MIGLYGKFLTIALAASLIGGGIMYVQKLRSDLALSEANNAKLEDAVETQQKAIKSLEADVKAKEIVNAQLREKNKFAIKETKSLKDKFEKENKKTGKKRDIGKAAVKKAKRIEKVINKGSVNAVRCLEIASGAPLTESEINATLRSEINAQCPDIANPNYIPK